MGKFDTPKGPPLCYILQFGACESVDSNFREFKQDFGLLLLGCVKRKGVQGVKRRNLVLFAEKSKKVEDDDKISYGESRPKFSGSSQLQKVHETIFVVQQQCCVLLQ